MMRVPQGVDVAETDGDGVAEAEVGAALPALARLIGRSVAS